GRQISRAQLTGGMVNSFLQGTIKMSLSSGVEALLSCRLPLKAIFQATVQQIRQIILYHLVALLRFIPRPISLARVTFTEVMPALNSTNQHPYQELHLQKPITGNFIFLKP